MCIIPESPAAFVTQGMPLILRESQLKNIAKYRQHMETDGKIVKLQTEKGFCLAKFFGG